MLLYKPHTIRGHLFRLLIVLSHPLHSIHQVADVLLDRNIVHPRLEAMVEVFVVVRVLFEDERTSRKEVREAVGSHSPIDVELVPILRVHGGKEGESANLDVTLR